MKYPQVVSMPSAVTNWLEEQLEARGIDAVLYTRYVLSLLHTHTVDVIYSDEDLHVSPLKKETRRSGGGRKRFRRSSEWWKHAHLDAEQLKRSAAVQCLMSASDQNCEIESLVDELCEKLKEIKNEQQLPEDAKPAPTQEVTDKKKQSLQQKKKVSPKEQAEKYYAAFPPLCPNTAATPTKLIKWIQSPKKKQGARKSVCRQSLGPKFHHYNHNSKFDSESGSNMKPRGGSSKQRFNYLSGRSKKEHMGICRGLGKSESLGNWDTSLFGCNSSIVGKKPRTNYRDSNAFINGAFEPERNDQCVVESNSWGTDEDMNMYDDLPVNIRELLDSPTPPEEDYTVEMMNLANSNDKFRENLKSNFISGNIISSIWSNNDDNNQLHQSMDDIVFDNRFNTVLDEESSGGLDRKFRSITIEEQDKLDSNPWYFDAPAPSAQNEANAYFERQTKNTGASYLEGFHSLPVWSNATETLEEDSFESEDLLNRIAVSLMKINHNKEESCFAEMVPMAKKPTPSNPLQSNPFNPFSFGSGSMFSVGARKSNVFEKEDLLTSERSHFRPINEKVEAARTQGEYADGATFIISNNLDKVNYKRSESGSMYLETEYGQNKKYCELYLEENSPTNAEFVLKFSICQNDKACQTDEISSNDEELFFEAICDETKEQSFEKLTDFPLPSSGEELKICTCPLTNNNGTIAMNMDNSLVSDGKNCAIHPGNRPESTMAEIMWKYEAKSCDKCNNNTLSWNADWVRQEQIGSEWDNQNLRNIWNGGEVCHACLNSNGGGGGRPPPDANLREDILQDGEQLLSDLSSMQKCYRDDLPTAAEITCDITDFFVPKERKRRHSYITSQHVSEANTTNRSSWSFASRLEEDCLIQMSTIPTLRSVTL